MKNFSGLVFFIGSIIASLMSWLLRGSVNAQVPMHWGLNGQPDRYGSRLEALVFLPAMLLFLSAVFGLVGLVSGARLKSNATRALNLTAICVTIFFVVLHQMLLSQNHDAVPKIIPLFLSGLLIVLGYAIRGVEPNPFIGIRVPWTMRSPMVWRKTHDRASRLWVVCGFGALIACLIGLPIVIPILIFTGSILYPLYDSYLISKTG